MKQKCCSMIFPRKREKKRGFWFCTSNRVLQNGKSKRPVNFDLQSWIEAKSRKQKHAMPWYHFQSCLFSIVFGIKKPPANCDKGLTKMMLFAFASGALLCANRNHQLLIINPKTKTKLLLTTMPFFLLFPRLHSIISLFHFPPNFS